jgi:hypothetical protein
MKGVAKPFIPKNNLNGAVFVLPIADIIEDCNGVDNTGSSTEDFVDPLLSV